MPPYFSVVIDNYNYGRFLGQAIDSVLAQDFPSSEVEIIVVDDGSTDESREVLRRYEGKVRAILQENRGQAGAFAAGFAAAKGVFVCPLDSDDYWHPEKLSEVAKVTKGDPSVGIVQHYQRDVDAQGNSLENPLPPWPERYKLDDFLNYRMQYAATSSLAFRRDVLDRVLPVPDDIFYLYDVYLIDHCLFHTDAANISKVLGCHRIHGANNWAQGYVSTKKMAGSIDELLAYRRHLEPKLQARGVALAPGFVQVQDMEIAKRRILIAMHEGRRGEAWTAWKKLFAEHGRTPFGAFRAASCLLALVSPGLYLRAYGLYSKGGRLARLRDAVAPSPNK